MLHQVEISKFRYLFSELGALVSQLLKLRLAVFGECVNLLHLVPVLLRVLRLVHLRQTDLRLKLVDDRVVYLPRLRYEHLLFYFFKRDR
jgi:hypothetical protein